MVVHERPSAESIADSSPDNFLHEAGRNRIVARNESLRCVFAISRRHRPRERCLSDRLLAAHALRVRV